jgi:hypothetical protein
MKVQACHKQYVLFYVTPADLKLFKNTYSQFLYLS